MSLLVGPTRNIIEQDPDDNLDYVADFSAALAGDTINTVSVTGTGVTVGSVVKNTSPIEVDEYGTLPVGSAVTFWLTGGTVGVPATVRVRVVSTLGRSIDMTYVVVLKQR